MLIEDGSDFVMNLFRLDGAVDCMVGDKAVRDSKLRRDGDILRGQAVVSVERGVGLRGLQNDQVGAVPFQAEIDGQVRDGVEIEFRVLNGMQTFLRGDDLCAESGLTRGEGFAEGLGVFLEGDAAFHDRDALVGVRAARDFDGMGEAVQQLRTEFAFLGVHGADDDELGRM